MSSSDSTDIIHYVFATSAPYSHAPAALRLCIRMVKVDPSVRVSVMLHANNLPTAEKILATAPEAAKHIKLWPVGEAGSFKDITRSYTELMTLCGGVYAEIIQDVDWPKPCVFIYDVTAFWNIPIKQGVEAGFPDFKPARMVGYIPGPVSAMLVLPMGSEDNGSLRWVADAAKEKGYDILNPDGDKRSDLDAFADASWSGGPDEVYNAVAFHNDRICKVPGVPPFHMYEYWSVDTAKWDGVKRQAMMQYVAASPQAVLATDAWITFFPSDVTEPEAVEAARTDPHLSDSGKKPLFVFGPVKALDKLEPTVKAFLDKHDPRTVALVSFGTLGDAGNGADILFEELAASNTPYVLAGGGQKSVLPEKIQRLIEAAEKEGRAVLPEWADLPTVLDHTSVLCIVTHCGANSTSEALQAGVPVLAWGMEMDQIVLSSIIGARGYGIELVQHRDGAGVGRPIAHRNGEILKGDPEALRAEIKRAFEELKGVDGETIRRKVAEVAADIEARQRGGGEWEQALRQFVKWTKDRQEALQSAV